MKTARIFMVAIAVFYFLNLVLLWPALWAPQLSGMYPTVDLHQGEPVFQLLLDAWLIVGIGLAVIGAVLLWGSRNPADYYKGLIPVVLLTEFAFGLWDAYSAFWSYEVQWMAMVTIAIHVVIIVWGWIALQRANAERVGAT